MPLRPTFARFFFLAGALLSFFAPARAAVAPPPLDSESGLPLLDVFTPRDYRGHDQVWNAAEDAAGLLYFGNLNQVLVYDGARWSTLPVPDATFVRGLAIDADDTLWIGGVDELGYAKTDPTGARTFVSLREKLPAEARACGDIWRTVITPRGVLFQTGTWLLRWSPTAQSFTTLRLADNSRWLLASVGPDFWLSSSRDNWFHLRDEGATLHLDALPVPPGTTGSRALAAVPSSTTPGEFLLATDRHGLWRWDGLTYTAFPTAIDAELRTAVVYGLCRLADGRLVLNTLLSGVWIIDAHGRLLAHLVEENGFPEKTALSLLATRDAQSLWIGLAGGVVRVDARPWLSWFHAPNGAPRARLYPPTRFRGELLAPATAAGFVRLHPATATTPARLAPEPTVTSLVNSLTPVGDSLILGTSHAFSEWAGRPELVSLPRSPSNATAFFPLTTRPGTWAALNNDSVRLYRRDATGWQTEGPIAGLERIRSLVEDRDGSWWSGRPVGGVLHTTFPHGPDSPVVETLAAPAALPAGHGWTRFSRDSTGPLLACDLGLFRYDPTARRFRATPAYGAALADGSTSVFALTPDDRDGLWMILRDSVAPTDSLHVPRLAYGHAGHLTPLRLPQLAGIQDPSHLSHESAAAPDRPETLWIAAHAALVRLNLTLWRAAPAEPAPRLRFRTVVTQTGRRLPLSGDWQLPDSDRSLRILFSAPALAADSTALYETTLVTGSGREVRTDTSAQRDFTALGSGPYTLTARARSPGGPWSPAITLAFTVLPPWWRSGLALSGYAAAALLALAFAWRHRALRYLRRQRELESAVAARTAELATQNAELVRLRQIEFDEKLAARLAEHKARLEVLRYQLNPHFLFNTLNAVCSQIIAAPRTARDTVIRLAEFCRLTLHRPGATEGEPTLGEEVEMLRAYLDIEQTRLGDLLDYTIECDPSLHELRLPPFLLLPLVENAVKYGAATSKDRVHIRLAFRPGPADGVLIEVANSGRWITPDTTERDVPSLGIGLENLRQRLARYFPGQHEFTTEPTDGWVVVRLRLHHP